MPRTETATGVPADRVEFTKQQFLNAGATDVNVEPDGPDTFSVIATFADEEEE